MFKTRQEKDSTNGITDCGVVPHDKALSLAPKSTHQFNKISTGGLGDGLSIHARSAVKNQSQGGRKCKYSMDT